MKLTLTFFFILSLLRSPDPTQVLSVQLFRQEDQRSYNLAIVRSPRSGVGRVRTIVHTIDLAKVVVMPVYATQSTQFETMHSQAIELTREPNSGYLLQLSAGYVCVPTSDDRLHGRS